MKSFLETITFQLFFFFLTYDVLIGIQPCGKSRSIHVQSEPAVTIRLQSRTEGKWFAVQILKFRGLESGFPD